MKKLNKKRTILVSLLFISIFFLGLFHSTKVSYAQPQYNNGSLTVTSNFSMIEFSDEIGTQENKSSIDIDLPSSSSSSNWNVTDMQVNFTDIEFSREIINVETDPIIPRYLGFDYFEALAVQINITDPTIIYGVHLYGWSINPYDSLVLVQIRGYDPIKNAPNETIYVSQTINMSTPGEMWHIQNFSIHKKLSEGNYTLVINATDVVYLNQRKSTEYRWYFNDINPMNPDLYVSTYSKDSGKWSNGSQGTPFLYKLDQKLNFTFEPEDINMHAEINGDSHPVLNGIKVGSGNLKLSGLNFSPDDSNLQIPIKNNKSNVLIFNLSYFLKLKSQFFFDGSVIIKGLSDNAWSLTPSIDRTNDNYSVKFKYPNSWYNLTVFRDGSNITKDVSDNGDYLIISNNSIIEGSDWRITANSDKVDFDASIPLSVYESGQTVKVLVNVSASEGNLTFFILDPYGTVEATDMKVNSSGTWTFSYTLPSNPFKGSWKALIFWNNYTDAGLQTLTFQVKISDGDGDNNGDSTIITGLDPQFVFLVVLIIIIGLVVGLTTYQAVMRYKRKQVEYRQKIYNKYMDVLNLDFIMISQKASGLNIYEQVISGEKRDATLISGFLQAIRAFGIELTGSEEQSQSIKLEYQKSRILMSEFKDFRIINIFKDSPSKDFKDSLDPLSRDIDKHYGKLIKNFLGDLSKFKGIEELLDKHLQLSLVYPLKVIIPKNIKLDSAEKMLVKKALNIMKKRNMDYFYVSYIFAEKEFNVRTAERILKLVEKKVFQPIR